MRRLAALAMTVVLAWLVVARMSEEGASSAALSLGVALIAAAIVGWLFEFLRLPRVTGYLVQRGAADGADVEQGAMLYRVDASDYQAALAQATGQRDRSIATLSYSRVSQTRNQILARDG